MYFTPEMVMRFASGNFVSDFADTDQTTVLSMREGYSRKENGKYKIPPEMLTSIKNSNG